MNKRCIAHWNIKAGEFCPICLIIERDKLRLENDQLKSELDRKNELLAHVDRRLDELLILQKIQAAKRHEQLDRLSGFLERRYCG